MPYRDKEEKKKNAARWHKLHKVRNNAISAAWRKRNPERSKELTNRWVKNNRERSNEIKNNWAKEHPEEVKEASAKFYANNKDKCREQNRIYNKKHPEVRVAAKSRRRTRVAKGGGSFSAGEWVSLCNFYGNRCLCCRKKKRLEADHVVPVSKGGSSNINNVQPLCRSCNARKGTKTTDYRK